GFGSFSKKFGSGAAGLLEAELVTWDGRIVVTNEYRHPKLYWALRGGGGATFGIVTRMTLLTHPLPETFGALTGTIKATSDQAFRVLIERFCEFYCQALNNEHWGEQFALLPDNSLTLALTFQGLDNERVATIWSPLLAWLGQHPADYQVDTDIVVVPARHMWDLAYWKAHHPGLVQPDPRPGADPSTFWWIGNGAEVSMYWYTYQSRWIPLTAFQSRDFAVTLFEASRHWRVSMHINKGLAGACSEALGRCRQTAVNPVVYGAAALVILGAGTQLSRPNPVEGAEQLGRVNAAMKILREATPNSGAYANEADYFEPDWQREFWGVHYAKLLEVKRRYDPIGLFHCHHGVGSEGWSADGMSRA
ncbi:BBE domain-containing protein, partial [bacterium]|nr:BBE domain-containing protein [bacterium]